MNWTEEQREAIELKNKNILVAAAAGSGKTAVLVERIRRLIMEDRCSVDNMLIVTFTNAAASEMKEKIRKAISSTANHMAGKNLSAVEQEQFHFLKKTAESAAFCQYKHFPRLCTGSNTQVFLYYTYRT